MLVNKRVEVPAPSKEGEHNDRIEKGLRSGLRDACE